MIIECVAGPFRCLPDCQIAVRRLQLGFGEVDIFYGKGRRLRVSEIPLLGLRISDSR